MSENITFPNDPPVDGDQFTIGNTTYAWDSAPGVWRAFVTATSSSGGGGATGFANAWGADGSAPVETVQNNGTTTLTGAASGTFFTITGRTAASGSPNINSTPTDPALTNTSANSWMIKPIEGRQAQATNVAGSSFWQGFLAMGDTVAFTGSSSNTFYTAWHWDAVTAAGGASTTVNIGAGGGGGGLSIPTNDEILEQTITTSGTLVAGDLTGTGPAWVVVSGGAGGSAGCGSNGGGGGAGSGGDGGTYAFFLDDVMDLVGGVLTAGAGGTGGAFIFGAIDPGVTICNDGSNGATTTFVINGTTITCTGGTRGRGSSIGPTNGTDGTSSTSGGTPPTELTITELNEAIDDYWEDFVIANMSTGALTIASFLADLDGAQGPSGNFSNTTNNVPAGGGGQNGGLYILYQNQ